MKGIARAACVAVLLGLSTLAGAQPVEVNDARRATYEESSDTWTLEGAPVRLRRLDLLVEAQVLRYRATEGSFEATGGVCVTRAGQLQACGDQARGSVPQQQVQLGPRVRARYAAGGREVELSASSAQVDFARRQLVARGAVRVTWGEAGLEAEEVSVDGPSEAVVADGSPVVTWEQARLSARRLRADLRGQRLWASGPVRLEHPTGWAQALEAEVHWPQRVAVLRGQVVAGRGADRVQAEELRYAWGAGVWTARGRSRVVVHP